MDTKVHSSLSAVLLCIWFMAFLILCCTESKQPPTEQKIAGKEAPDFTLKDLSGQKFSLSNHRGNYVLLIFTTTWCPSCRSEVPHYKSIHHIYGRRGLEIVNIDIQESRNKVSLFADKYRIPYRIVIDETGEVSRSYGIVGVPHMILIGKDGNIVSQQYSAMDMILETTMGKH